MTNIETEYATLKGKKEKIPAQWIRQNVLLDMIYEKKGICRGIYLMDCKKK